MTTFRIVENFEEDFTNIYDDFKKDFLNPKILKSDLIKKYGLNPSKYEKLRLQVLDGTGLTHKPYMTGFTYTRNLSEMCYIRKRKPNLWSINKTVNGHKKQFGTYDDLDTCKNVRNMMIEFDWDLDKCYELREKYAVKGTRSKTLVEKAMQYYDDFERLFFTDATVKEICDKLNFTNYQYKQLREHLLEKYDENSRYDLIKNNKII